MEPFYLKAVTELLSISFTPSILVSQSPFSWSVSWTCGSVESSIFPAVYYIICYPSNLLHFKDTKHLFGTFNLCLFLRCSHGNAFSKYLHILILHKTYIRRNEIRWNGNWTALDYLTIQLPVFKEKIFWVLQSLLPIKHEKVKAYNRLQVFLSYTGQSKASSCVGLYLHST